jgi:plasmid replication initiation protein
LIDKKGNEQFERISDFKIKVLDIARKQISENTDIELDYELKKKGKKFYWITLNINSQKFASKLITYGLSQEQAELIAEKEKDFDILIQS